MGKKLPKGNWKRNLPNSTDKSFINTWHYFVPEDFEYFVPKWLEKYIDQEKLAEYGWNPPLAYKEVCCRLLNFWKTEYVTLRNNGEPKSSYKPEVSEKITAKKEPRLEKKIKACEALFEVAGMKLKASFDRLDKNNEPKFMYEVKE